MREKLPGEFTYPRVKMLQEGSWKGHRSEKKAIHEAACVDAGEVQVRNHPVRYVQLMLSENA
jgi:hypothetical protein